MTHHDPYILFAILPVCEKDVLAVSSTSAEEHRQPFKDKMEAFLLTGEHRQLT